MKTLIILCAGKNQINTKPLFMNVHPNGKTFLEKSVEGIYLQTYDRVVCTILQEFEQNYNASQIILNVFKDIGLVPEIVILDRETRGPADSVYITVMKAGIEGETAIRDCANTISLNKSVSGNFVCCLDLINHSETIFNLRSKSFIVKNEQGQILDIVEKRFRSDVFSIGFYGFSDIKDFLEAYNSLNDRNYMIRSLYLSHVISYLTGYKEQIFYCYEVCSFEDWSCYKALMALHNNYATCLINIDKLLVNSNEMMYEHDIIAKIRNFSNKKVSVLLFSNKDYLNTEYLKDLLEKYHINCKGIITGISNSEKQYIINNEQDLNSVIQSLQV